MIKKKSICCDECMHYMYDEEYETYLCAMDLDQDERMQFLNDPRRGCPYYRPGDEYTIVRKQI